jgi:hypothetical protein
MDMTNVIILQLPFEVGLIDEVTYRLVAHTIAIQFRDTFVEHFNPHQFGVAICGGCEIMVHGI